uniref:UV-stimulated scaffold protein A C-terminal domain-containing protein n=1 Tax=Lygus hesperus TaxID=30085 RepID=A0A0K8T5M2_LYGHE
MSSCTIQKLSAEQFRELKKLLEGMTHSGSKTLCQRELEALFSLLESDERFIDAAFGLLKGYLKKEHSEVRFSTVQIYNELFLKYDTIREKVLERLDKFFRYALGLKCRIPPPDAAAQALVPLAIGVFDLWHTRFGSNCMKLRNGYNLLKNVHNVDFSTKSFVDPKERKEKEENRKRLLKINKERLKNSNKQMEELKPEIEASLTSLDSCFELLLPSDDLLQTESTEGPSNEETDMRLYGVVNSRDFNIEINLDDKVEIVEDDENSPILEAANDSFKIINNSFLPKVTAWVELITIAEGERELLKTALYLKDRLDAVVAKYNRLQIVKPPPRKQEDEYDEVTSDSDLEEVPEFKPDRRTVTREEIGFLSERLDLLKAKRSKDGECSNVKREKEKLPESEVPSSELEETEKTSEKIKTKDRKAQLLEVAPKLPYDIDLYHWEDEKLPTPTLVPVNTEGGRFWGASISEEIGEVALPGGSESLRSRVIEFTGKFEPVTRACRAPLPSGKLCPRHDRRKCPLHGVIVDRDEEGKIVNPEDEEKVKKSTKASEVVPDWQDPKLLAEIKAATGIDLKMPVKGQRLKKKKHPGLTDINPKVDTPESRIAKKIFNKRALKRVAATLDKLDQKRYRDKFGDQFNYVHDTS